MKLKVKKLESEEEHSRGSELPEDKTTRKEPETEEEHSRGSELPKYKEPKTQEDHSSGGDIPKDEVIREENKTQEEHSSGGERPKMELQEPKPHKTHRNHKSQNFFKHNILSDSLATKYTLQSHLKNLYMYYTVFLVFDRATYSCPCENTGFAGSKHFNKYRIWKQQWQSFEKSLHVLYSLASFVPK